MDEFAAKKFVETSILRLKEAAKQLGITENDVVQKDEFIYVPIPSRKHNRKFMLRALIDKEYPENPADYSFVNPETRQDTGIVDWPNDGGNAFKQESPPWICMAGTRAWVQRGNHPNPGLQVNLIENVVFSIFAKLNKEA